MQHLPLYYETDAQIFVHAGVDEAAGEYWSFGTSENTLLGKFPAAKGKFYKTVIAGDVYKRQGCYLRQQITYLH